MKNSFEALPGFSDSWALFLDVDGTLVELADTPDLARPSPALFPALETARDILDGAIALVSGRPLSGVDRLVPMNGPAAGMHGLERRKPDGSLVEIPEPLPSLRKLAEDMLVFEAANEGIIFEDKGPSVTLHYRLAPHLEQDARALVERHREAIEQHYNLLEGKMMIEVKPHGASKAGAVEAFMDEHPFRGRVPVFIGDDITDEDGFRACNALGGITIWVSDDPQSRETEARHWLSGVPAVIEWLERLGKQGKAA
jgi:trehalose 6-phosphate phosphatase